MGLLGRKTLRELQSALESLSDSIKNHFMLFTYQSKPRWVSKLTHLPELATDMRKNALKRRSAHKHFNLAPSQREFFRIETLH